MPKYLRAGALILVFLITGNIAWSQTTVTLKQALILAKKQNPDLKTASYDMDISRADVITSRLRPNPALNTQLLGTTNPGVASSDHSPFSPINSQTWYQLTKPVVWQGIRNTRIDFSNKMLAQSQYNYQETARQVYYQVANQWLNVWEAKINLDLLHRAKATIDSLVNINEVRYKDQEITSTDLMRARLLQEQYERSIITSQQSYNNELQNLKYLTGINDSLMIDLNDETFNSINSEGDSLIQMGLTSRSDLMAAKNSIDASESNIRLQKELSYPVPELGLIWNPQNMVHYFGFYGTIAIPIFDRNQGERQKSEVLKLQNEQAYDAIQKQIQTEVSTSYHTYTVEKQNISQYEKNLVTAENILKNIQYAYLKGGTTIIDFLEAQRSWLDTQQQYYNALLEFRRSYIQLLFSTGLINQIAEE